MIITFKNYLNNIVKLMIKEGHNIDLDYIKSDKMFMKIIKKGYKNSMTIEKVIKRMVEEWNSRFLLIG